MAEFLSPSWLAELDAAARRSDTLAELGRRAPLTVEQRVTGGPQGDVTYHLALAVDGVRVHAAPAARPDIVLTTDHATALAIHHGTTNLQHALAADRAKVRGDLRELRAHSADLAAIDDVFRSVRTETTAP